jgi:Galactose oxidase, central domain/Kelch motif
MSTCLPDVNVNIEWTRLTPQNDTSTDAGDSASGRKPCSRSSHGVSIVQSNTKLVLYGGETVARTPLDSDQSTWICELVGLDDSPKWRSVSSKQQQVHVLPPPRVAHAQAVYNDRYVYIFGGRAGITMDERAMNDLWVFDSVSEEWTEVKYEGDGGGGDSIPEPRSFHQMVCVGEALYVFGGCSASHGRLADMYKFDIPTKVWSALGSSQHLRGRGGATLLPFKGGKALGVVAGFAGEETNDGHIFDITKQQWSDESLTADLLGLRPRSVCVGGSFPSIGLSLIFGGEVDPSSKGHEGAGGFANDLVLLDESTGKYITSIPSSSTSSSTDDNSDWPDMRGWSSAASVDSGDGSGQLFVFGGLTGDDTNPRRLDDLWRLTISKKE